jgi:hypothetical protein
MKNMELVAVWLLQGLIAGYRMPPHNLINESQDNTWLKHTGGVDSNTFA